MARVICEIAFKRRRVHVGADAHIMLVFPPNSPWVSSNACHYVPPFHFQRFWSNIPWHPTSVMANCSTCIDFMMEQIFKQSRRSEIIIHKNLVSQSLNSSNYLQHSSTCRCYFSRCMLPLLAQINTHVISVSQRVTKFVNFDAKSFTFLWNILPKHYPSFIQHDFIHDKAFCWILHFTKFVAQSVKNLSHFPKSIVVWVITAQGVVSLKNGGIVECGKSSREPSHLNKMEYSTVPLWNNNL